MHIYLLRLMVLSLILASPLRAETGGWVLQGARTALIPLPGSPGTGSTPASLFTGPEGLFAPVRPAPKNSVRSPHRQIQVARLLDLIASAEAGSKGYDAVQYGARIKPPKRPTAMTVGEIYIWITDTPHQPHAIGRYQFIPKTLRRLVRTEEIPLGVRFSPEIQDRLALRLLNEAGLKRFQAGTLPRAAFMNNLAKIWAGLPNASGQSHYHGYSGNKATISRARFDREMRQIFNDRS